MKARLPRTMTCRVKYLYEDARGDVQVYEQSVQLRRTFWGLVDAGGNVAVQTENDYDALGEYHVVDGRPIFMSRGAHEQGL